jgi:hypothetical protein
MNFFMILFLVSAGLMIFKNLLEQGIVGQNTPTDAIFTPIFVVVYIYIQLTAVDCWVFYWKHKNRDPTLSEVLFGLFIDVFRLEPPIKSILFCLVCSVILGVVSYHVPKSIFSSMLLSTALYFAQAVCYGVVITYRLPEYPLTWWQVFFSPFFFVFWIQWTTVNWVRARYRYPLLHEKDATINIKQNTLYLTTTT